MDKDKKKNAASDVHTDSSGVDKDPADPMARAPRGSGVNKQSSKTCCGFFWTGYPPSDRREYPGCPYFNGNRCPESENDVNFSISRLVVAQLCFLFSIYSRKM